MTERKELLAYCGGYCGDCLGHTGVIADAAANLKTVVDTYKVDQTVECVFPEQDEEYEKFYEMLEFMTNLKCPKICRERKDEEVSCEIVKCCRERGFFACYECDDLETCCHLKSKFSGLHYESNMKNLRSVKKMGLEKWLTKGKRYCYWDEAGDK
ncbi:MAG: DUF3795 domain-containing protein [Candidatus Methanofastidiosia archaeon]